MRQKLELSKKMIIVNYLVNLNTQNELDLCATDDQVCIYFDFVWF